MKDDRRQRIALLVGQPEEYTQSCFISGFLETAFAHDSDVFVYAMYIKYQNNPAREKGEASIFSLIPYDKFDAVVVMADTIQTPGVASAIDEKLHEVFAGKVLFVDKESKYFPSVNADNHYPMKKVVSHLIEKHGLKDIAFLAGKSWHPHSLKRLNAYKETMIEHGLKVDDDRVYYGDFWYSSGESLAMNLISSGKKLPEAVVCANDCMAVGLAKAFIKGGVRVPEDIKIAGYDSNEDGRHSPIPITSVPIPSREFGSYTADTINDLLKGIEPKEFISDPELFIGGSCGCGCDSAKPVYFRRDLWDTDLSSEAIFSVFNHMDDDLLEQGTMTGLISSIFSYTYLIKDYDSFDICLNRDWENFCIKESNRGRFSEDMIDVISCGSEEENRAKISFNRMLRSDDLLPEAYEQKDRPRVFFFMPLNYEDLVFGFAAVSYHDHMKGITGEYRSWLRSISRGLEYFRRTDSLRRGNEVLETSSLRDNLTGLYNYQGFYKQAETFLGLVKNNGGFVSVMAVDICDLSKINNKFSRREGDNAIVAVASILETTFNTRNCLCFCIGNGEIVVARISSVEGDSEMIAGREEFLKRLNEYNAGSGEPYKLSIYYGIESGSPTDVDSLEMLVNLAVSKKNSLKSDARRLTQDQTLTSEEQHEANTVRHILDDNKFSYHFQPIVSAYDGSIFAYEALMRPDVKPSMSPEAVLRYAGFFDRLYDVEKATFSNVMKIACEKNITLDGKRKIFINSIPGYNLKMDAVSKLQGYLDELKGAVVVEMTEKSELGDDELKKIKDGISELGLQIAVDDYGTGYSNVTNLLRYMPDYVKIDRLLLSGIHVSPQKQHFVRDIVQFSHDNGILALAEGVETADELNAVIALGVDLLQGYYIARPSEEIMGELPKERRDEIIDCYMRASSMTMTKTYNAGRESRINLISLKDNNYTAIVVEGGKKTYNDFIVAGVPGIDTDVRIVIKEGYKGRITLDNVTLGNVSSGDMAIDIASGCNVTLVLRGNNYLNGSIRVEEDAVLSIEGDGLLAVNVSGDDYYGIGNSAKEKHGDITLETNGTLSIMGSGKTGIGIGSGKGGSLAIRRGKYILNLMGDEGVGIGALKGTSDVRITECSVEMRLAYTRSVGLGSMDGDAVFNMNNVGLNIDMTGRNCVALGSCGDGKVDIFINSVGIDSKIKSARACVLGSMAEASSSGDVNIRIRYANIKADVNGENGIFAGDLNDHASVLDLEFVSVKSTVRNALNYDVGARLVNTSELNMEASMNLNGVERMRLGV